MDEVRIITNNQPRDLMDGYQLTVDERAEFEYIAWDAIEQGEESATFFRYKGTTYDLGEFMSTHGLPEFSPLVCWDGYQSDSFFSGILVRYCNNFESIVVARYLS